MWKRRTQKHKPVSKNYFGQNYLYKRYHNQKKMEYLARTGRLKGKLLDSGFYEGPTYGALNKAWLAYIISCKHDDMPRRQYYAAVIQKLERDLKIEQYDFPEIKGMAADFLDECEDDPDIRDMSLEEIEEIMRKSDSDFWKRVRGEEE